MIPHSAFNRVSIERLAPDTPQVMAISPPVMSSVQMAAGQPALPQHAVPPYETFLSSLSFVLAAIVATAELVRMSGGRARRRAAAHS